MVILTLLLPILLLFDPPSGRGCMYCRIVSSVSLLCFCCFYDIYEGSGRRHSLNGHFSTTTGVRRYRNVSILDFIGARDDWDGDDSWRYKDVKKLQSNRHYQQTDTQLCTLRMPFVSPDQQRQSIEGRWD